MKKFFIFCLICALPGFMLVACQRDQGVEAGNERGTDTYQPRAAPPPKGEVQHDAREVRGELIRVDMAGKTVAIRVENGMEQTFKFDDQTMVTGLESQPATAPRTGAAYASAIRNLMGKEGSEVVVHWRDDNGAKMAASVNVIEVHSAKPAKAGKKR